MVHRIAFIGFGGVGQALTEILRDRAEFLRREIGLDISVVAATDSIKGSVYDPAGLELDALLAAVQDGGRLDSYSDAPGVLKGWDSVQIARDCNADTIVEVTFTDLQSGQPAIEHCRLAFRAGKNVVTSNKGPVALAYRELADLARTHRAQFGFEGSVMSGTPSLYLGRTGLRGNVISEVRGIFNGTTNYILSRMEEGLAYGEALREAQHLGYAEADPTNDVEGFDTLGKVVILANVVLGAGLQVSDVSRRGISHLTGDEIERARAERKRWKLIGRVARAGDGWSASVGPEMVASTDPLAGVMGATNAITYHCDLLGPVTLIGAGAGRKETGYALLSDLIRMTGPSASGQVSGGG